MGEALRAKFLVFFYIVEDVPHAPFLHDQYRLYNFVADSIHTNFIADFLPVKCTF